jgi:hypothetical protein
MTKNRYDRVFIRRETKTSPPDFAKVGFQTEFASYVPVLITFQTYCMLIWTNVTYFNTHVNTDVWVLHLCYELPAGAKKALLLSFNARSLQSFLKKKERAARWREKSITRALPDARSPRLCLERTEKRVRTTHASGLSYAQKHHSSRWPDYYDSTLLLNIFKNIFTR